MGKTKGTAENLASYIGKMAKPEMAEKLEKLNQGKVSVRATRAERLPGERRGRPAKTNIQKLSEHLSAAGALALVCKLDLQRYLDMAQAAYEGSVAGLSEPKTDEPKAESTNKPEPKPEPEAKPELVAA